MSLCLRFRHTGSASFYPIIGSSLRNPHTLEGHPMPMRPTIPINSHNIR
jgi:hypothetical protein